MTHAEYKKWLLKRVNFYLENLQVISRGNRAHRRRTIEDNPKRLTKIINILYGIIR